ncbi:MAG TPA: NAD(P)H-hydrate dehydratase, partial [Anaerolineaceae bacterium]|nr:NAD(P)H-hydrate dehydratase [Anaerolineaceae bacterium]
MPMNLVSVNEMKAIEVAANVRGVTYAQMMQHAGQGIAEVVLRELGHLDPLSVVGLVGPGNNGGDTLVALTSLQKSGWCAQAYLTRTRGAEDALLNDFLQAGGKVLLAAEDSGYATLDHWLAESSVLLDGVLGTGFILPLKPELEALLGHVSMHVEQLHIVAVDCPSGVDCDSGQIATVVLPAEITVCMAAVKTGLLRFPAYQRVGQLEVVEIGLPVELPEWQAVQAEVVNGERVRALLPERRVDGHKGSFGTLLAVGGSVNYTGAIGLAARAAYRMGCGLVRVAIPGALHAALAGTLLEATWLLLPHEMGVIAADAAEVLAENIAKVDALLLGPGMGQEDTSAEFVRRLVSGKAWRSTRGNMGFMPKSNQRPEGGLALPPLVVDADGLHLLARQPEWSQLLPPLAVLTPHPGEMSALTGMPVEEIQRDRFAVARKFAAQWGHVVVLKGALTVVASPDGRLGVIPVATSALAKAGTGDVLAGMIASLRAQGVMAYDAAICAAWMHAQAGLVAECWVGHAAGVMAGDVAQAIP